MNTERQAIETVLSFLRGETERVTTCGDHPEGHSQRVGSQYWEDLQYIREVLEGVI